MDNLIEEVKPPEIERNEINCWDISKLKNFLRLHTMRILGEKKIERFIDWTALLR